MKKVIIILILAMFFSGCNSVHSNHTWLKEYDCIVVDTVESEGIMADEKLSGTVRNHIINRLPYTRHWLSSGQKAEEVFSKQYWESRTDKYMQKAKSQMTPKQQQEMEQRIAEGMQKHQQVMDKPIGQKPITMRIKLVLEEYKEFVSLANSLLFPEYKTGIQANGTLYFYDDSTYINEITFIAKTKWDILRNEDERENLHMLTSSISERVMETLD